MFMYAAKHLAEGIQNCLVNPCAHAARGAAVTHARNWEGCVLYIASVVLPTLEAYVLGKPAITPSSMESVTSAMMKSAIVIYVNGRAHKQHHASNGKELDTRLPQSNYDPLP